MSDAVMTANFVAKTLFEMVNGKNYDTPKSLLKVSYNWMLAISPKTPLSNEITEDLKRLISDRSSFKEPKYGQNAKEIYARRNAVIMPIIKKALKLKIRSKASTAKAIVAASQDVKKFVDSSECVRELSSLINNEPSRKYLRLTFSLWKKENKSKNLPTKPGFKKLWTKLGEALEGAVNVGNEDGWEWDEDFQSLDHLYEAIAKAR